MKRLPMARAACLVDIARQHGELVAAETREHVVAARRAAEALDHRLQHLVADRVAVAIVDALEAVEVEQEDGVRAARRGGELRRHVERLEQHAAVRQAGQRILHGELAQLAHLGRQRVGAHGVAALLVEAPGDEDPHADDAKAAERTASAGDISRRGSARDSMKPKMS